MFTGLIEAVGRVARIVPIERGRRLLVETELARELAPGDSLATNGCCLTVTRLLHQPVTPPRTAARASEALAEAGLALGADRDWAVTDDAGAATGVLTDVSPETLRVTTLGDLAVGSRLNLERSMRADGRFGGHIVQGHVDGTGVITAFEQEGEFYRLEVRFPQELAPYFIHKGSVAVDGISLTIAALHDDRFAVQIIPQTWAKTNLQGARPGREVNLECDLVGKYVLRAAELAARAPSAPAAPPDEPVRPQGSLDRSAQHVPQQE